MTLLIGLSMIHVVFGVFFMMVKHPDQNENHKSTAALQAEWNESGKNQLVSHYCIA